MITVDYMIPAGDHAWITAGNYSLFVKTGSAGECIVQVYKLNDESSGCLLNEEFKQ
jgi:hypothetical protein